MAEAFKPAPHRIKAKIRNPLSPASLKCVKWTETPGFAKTYKLAPAQTKGIRYERQVEQHLSSLAEQTGLKLVSHKWIAYNKSFAQIDFLLLSESGAIILLEAKRTWVDTANQRRFYKELLKKLGFNPITSCTVCFNLTTETPKNEIIQDFHDIKEGSVWQLRV